MKHFSYAQLLSRLDRIARDLERRLKAIRKQIAATKALEEKAWDRQMDRDAKAGKLAPLREEARRARKTGKARPFPK